jgi:medium-chain acyl-[acyl-carrier-protein] hydrolase
MSVSAVLDPWLAYLRPRPRPSVRLFCFPYAGGGASVFRGWADGLPDSVEVCPVQLPGREARFREPAFTRLGPLTDAVAGALRPYLDRPFALFGHSLGALVAFELARRLDRDGGPQPVRLFVSGCAAPSVPRGGRPIHGLPDSAFRAELRRLNGTPAAVLDNAELMEILLPTLRADFALCETYAFAPRPPLTCPISCWGGLGDDTASRQDLDAWREQTAGPFRLRMLPGDHFFVRSARPLLLRSLAQELLAAGAAPAPRPAVPGRTWEPAAEPPALGEGGVHVWRVRLDQPEKCRSELRRLLSADEEVRARRFHFRRDRDRFVVCRGALRTLLGRYLAHDPRRLRFAYGAHGKPALAAGGAAGRLSFNVAHSDGLALVAVTRGREVGVDLERVRPGLAAEEIAARYFSPREFEALRALPRSLRPEAFFHCWTRKEAYLKATGAGVARALDRFDVTLRPGDPAALLENRDDPAEARRWSLRELVPGPGFVGALAVEGRPGRLWCGDWGARTAAPAGGTAPEPGGRRPAPAGAEWGGEGRRWATR